MLRTPQKPFETYKWRWATATPTEGLDEPAVFLGVLRALAACEGSRPNDPRLFELLKQVQAETGTSVDLARTPERNLLRNSQQYWKALGLIEGTQPIKLTPMGRAVASGGLSVGDFAAAVVRSHQLPNERIESDATLEEWRRAGLRLKPLELLLSIIRGLDETAGPAEAYVETQELIRIIIPLAGDDGTIEEYVAELLSRRRTDVFPNWPDCCPESNDKRWAREFLLFLWHYGYCRKDSGISRDTEKYFRAEENVAQTEALLDLVLTDTATLDSLATDIRKSGVAISAERRKVTREITERPGQARFRRDVLAAYRNRCALTGETVDAALEACHIQPANEDGPDSAENGICLRADLHKLYDKGYIRIDPTGHVRFAAELESSPTYSALPEQIDLACEETAQYLSWRERYSG